MNKSDHSFDTLIETVYNLSFEDKIKLKILLEHNIIKSKRNQIVENFKQTLEQQIANQLPFSSDINELKKML